MNSITPLTIKIGGIAGGHGASIEVIARTADPSCVVVHGGGSEVADWLRRLDLKPEIRDGLRVTDSATLEVAVAVLAGLVNTRLVSAFATTDRPAIGLTCADAGLLTLARAGESLGEVGHPVAADVRILDLVIGAGLLPVISSIGRDADGSLLNVNADAAAAAIAAARGGRLLLCSDVPGVLRDGVAVPALNTQEATGMIADGGAQGGMVPKLEAAIGAARAGCDVWILDGRSPELLAAAIGGDPMGTHVLAVAGEEVPA